ncbi:PAS domain-containing sensor histidine kinase [Ideonella paludis]|uniref:histidine kinase n=1 Tax=Ideonella paludis TaxID=1233411 RepID=A0ABS5E133_9BURK|nr:PAS domain-containing sensor histidine kinase [Ideonella paludis]MBQ0937120.1 PAS domain-containing sensor histidine kinase [Ideonella paludis]
MRPEPSAQDLRDHADAGVMSLALDALSEHAPERARALLKQGHSEPAKAMDDVWRLHTQGVEEQMLQTQDMLHQVEQFCAWQSQLLHGLPVPVLLLNRHGAIIEANDEALRLIGHAGEETAPLLLLSRLFPQGDAGSRLRLALTAAVSQGSAKLEESALMCLDGRQVWAELRMTRVRPRQEGARAIELACVIVDLTDRRIAREAEERARDAEQERSLAEQAAQTKTQLLSRVSHELRTPLNAVQGFCQLLQMNLQSTPDKRNEYLQHISTASKQLLELVEEMLDLNRAESGHLNLCMGPTSVAVLVPTVLAQHEPMAAPLNLSLSADLPEDAPDLRADARRVRHILTNLVSNAVKYNRQGGQVLVRLGHNGKEGWVEVEDSGIGLSEAQLAHLFEPFNRLGAEQSGSRGFGLGLSICKAYADAMGGRLEAWSNVGVGSRFRLTLPRWMAESS